MLGSPTRAVQGIRVHPVRRAGGLRQSNVATTSDEEESIIVVVVVINNIIIATCTLG